MAKRLISAAIMIVITLAALIFGQIYTSALVFVMSLIGSYEFYHAFDNTGKKPMKAPLFICLVYPLIIFISTILLTIDLEKCQLVAKVLLKFDVAFEIILIALLAVMLEYVLKHKKYNLESAAISLLGATYVSMMFSTTSLIRIENGLSFLIFPILSSLLCDTFALFGGLLFGKHKLCETISPKKTVEGAIAGTIGSFVLCIGYYFLCPVIYGEKMTLPNDNVLPLWLIIILAIIIPVVSQVGDLFASSIKRECKIKDYGNLIPGHGGILDRIDSVIPSVFIFYLIISFYSLWL